MNEIPTTKEITRFVEEDIPRLLFLLRKREDKGEAGIIYSSEMCIKGTKKAFLSSYLHSTNALRQLIGGPRVKKLEFIVLEDTDLNFWGDYAVLAATMT